jgi:hypothetical protein
MVQEGICRISSSPHGMSFKELKKSSVSMNGGTTSIHPPRDRYMMRFVDE